MEHISLETNDGDMDYYVDTHQLAQPNLINLQLSIPGIPFTNMV